jgi:spore coat protein U-like protein
MKRLCIIAALLLFACAVKPASAANCTAYASSVVFGNYTGSLIDVTATITVTCDTAGTAFQIGLNAGNGPGATITNRMMFGGTGGSNTLGYQLFNNASRTINWGNSSGTGWVTGTATAANTAMPYTIYARMPANENSPLGSYTDTITASITGSFTTTIASLSVTATVAPSCTITANTLNFGGYSGAVSNATATLSVQCANGTPYNVGLDPGQSSGATVTTRAMMNGSKSLSYALYSDTGRTRNWGNTVGTDTVVGTGSGSAQILTVYGQVPAGQKPAPGSYADTVTATLTY